MHRRYRARTTRAGWLTTLGKFSQLYGRFEMRVRFPAGGVGTHPALWLMPDDNVTWPPEIDVA
jgi:beta-glucanase (GH16 family)